MDYNQQPQYNGNMPPQNQQYPQYQQAPQYQQYQQAPQYQQYQQAPQYQQYQQAPQYQQYQQAPPQGPPLAYQPVGMLSTNRGLVKYILLSLITFGIYGLIAMSGVSTDINIIAQRYDGKKTMHFLLMSFIVSPLTLGIYGIVWFHTLSNRIGNELIRRGISYNFSATDFWLWCVLGSLIIVGPFIYIHKLFEAMNQLSESYNQYG